VTSAPVRLVAIRRAQMAQKAPVSRMTRRSRLSCSNTARRIPAGGRDLVQASFVATAGREPGDSSPADAGFSTIRSRGICLGRFPEMTTHRRLVIVALTAGLVLPLVGVAQDLHPSRRPSPLGWSRTTLGSTYISVVYGRPYKRGRNNIFGMKGAIVPFGERWRTGANEATEITTTGDLLVGGKPLRAGTYSLFTTPGPETWSIHFNSRLGLDGTGTFADGKFTPVELGPTDVLTVTAKAVELPENKEVDQFTIDFERTGAGADLVLRWIRTEVRVPIATASR
jgi:hypothetical protein